MLIRLTSICCLLMALFSQAVAGATLVEIKLIAPLEESRGWCVDLFAHLTGAMPIGGFQGHNCFSYPGGGMASGPEENGPALDQGFDAEMFLNEGRVRLVYFDICMTLHEPRAGSFVASEPCIGEPAQQFELKVTGEIVPTSAPNLCLTAGSRIVTGGGGDPIHLIRKLSFEECDAQISDRQRWELRSEYEESVPTLPRPYI